MTMKNIWLLTAAAAVVLALAACDKWCSTKSSRSAGIGNWPRICPLIHNFSLNQATIASRKTG